MQKKIIIGLALVVAIIVAVYVVSVILKEKELDEPSPLDQVSSKTINEVPVVKDSLDSMDKEKEEEFHSAVEAMKDIVMVKKETMPEGPRILTQGEFKARAHNVQGEALLIKHNGKQTLRFENFETINGPNLHIYLSTELGVEDAIDLGKIRATKGNVNYEIDSAIDTTRYNKVLVWCVPFKVLFSYAELK